MDGLEDLAEHTVIEYGPWKNVMYKLQSLFLTLVDKFEYYHLAMR